MLIGCIADPCPMFTNDTPRSLIGMSASLKHFTARCHYWVSSAICLLHGCRRGRAYAHERVRPSVCAGLLSHKAQCNKKWKSARQDRSDPDRSILWSRIMLSKPVGMEKCGVLYLNGRLAVINNNCVQRLACRSISTSELLIFRRVRRDNVVTVMVPDCKE